MGRGTDARVGGGTREERVLALTDAALVCGRAYARTKGAGGEDAQDAAAEALVRLAQGRGGRAPTERTLRDVVRQILRRERRRGSRRVPLDGVDEPAARGGGPLERAELEERARLLREAVARLAAADRDLLTVVYLDSVSSRVVARRLRLTEAAVRQRLARARRRLRVEIERTGAGW